MTKFHIFFAGPIEQETTNKLNDFIELLTKFCQVPRAQALKFKNISWEAGITIELPKKFRVEQGKGPHHMHPTNLYYKDVLIAENIGLSQTEIHLDNLQMVTNQHLRKPHISAEESKNLKDRMMALMQQKALDKAKTKAHKKLNTAEVTTSIKSSYLTATRALINSSPSSMVAIGKDSESQVSLPDCMMSDAEDGFYDEHTHLMQEFDYDSDEYDDCDQKLERRFK